MRFITVITLLLLPLGCVFSQSDSPDTLRLKKYERIYLAAYDDTTRALAALFLAKRHQIIGLHSSSEIERYIGLNMKTNWIVFGVSSAVLVTGLVMAGNNAPPPEGHEEDYSFLIPLLGAMGMISSGINLGAQYIMLTPYTVKKYFRLLAKYRADGQLPAYYAKRIKKYM
ncbi:MAG: hypothetical protein L6Q51_11635 [Cyclobacteriaceae bacterium]|nr:hypothetical protein [Cyclobacteriaceae bacterium]